MTTEVSVTNAGSAHLVHMRSFSTYLVIAEDILSKGLHGQTTVDKCSNHWVFTGGHDKKDYRYIKSDLQKSLF